MKHQINKTCTFFMMSLCLIGLSTTGLLAQQPHASLSSTQKQIIDKEKSNSSTLLSRTDPEPRYIDGNLTWARNLVDPSVYPGFGSGVNNDFMTAHRYETGDLAQFHGKSLSRVGFIPTQNEGTYTAKVWKGGSALNPGQLVAEVTFSSVTAFYWNEVAVVPSVQIDSTQELWIGIQCVSEYGYPMGFDAGPQVTGKGNLYTTGNNQWAITENEDPFNVLNILNFCIRGFVQDVAINATTSPTMPANFNVTPNANYALSANLSWINPSQDIYGNNLSGINSMVILRNGTEIHTINNPTMGQTASFEDNSVTEMGWYNYSIYATGTSGNGLCATKTVFVGPMILMNTSGTQTVSFEEFYLYDDGGKFDRYSNNADGILTINPITPDVGIKISGTYMIESDFDKLFIYDGTDTNGELLFTFSSTEGGIIPEITSSSGSFTLHFTTDNSFVTEGFEIHVQTISINNDCLQPNYLSVGVTDMSSASLSWAPGAGNPESYVLAYKPVNAGEFTEIEGITDLPYTLTGLTELTEYEWKVRTVCSNVEEPSSWSISSYFTTTCEGINAPLIDNFDSYEGGIIPECWQHFAGLTADWLNRIYPCVDDYPDFAHSGERYIKFWSTSTAEENLIALPVMVESIRNTVVSFYARNNVNNPFFEIGVMEGNNFVSVQEFTTLTEEYQQFTVNMNSYLGSGNRIAFRSFYSGIAHVFLDDIEITSTTTNYYTITATAGENGTITPSGTIEVEEGDNQTFTFTPNEGYNIEDVIVDGESIGVVANYTFENITANHSISVTFIAVTTSTYTITATAGENGTITPSGTIEVEEGDNQTFTFTPDEGYDIEDVVVDGESIGVVANYTFENITANHSISVAFKEKLAINELTQQFSVFPNPANNAVIVEGENLESISVYNISGQLVEVISVINETSKTIQTATYKNGAYIFRLQTKEGNVASHRIMIIH